MHRGRPASIQGSISDDKSSKTTADQRGARKSLCLHKQPIVAEVIQALPKFRRNPPERCRLLAQGGHRVTIIVCPLSGAKRTSRHSVFALVLWDTMLEME